MTFLVRRNEIYKWKNGVTRNGGHSQPHDGYNKRDTIHCLKLLIVSYSDSLEKNVILLYGPDGLSTVKL